MTLKNDKFDNNMFEFVKSKIKLEELAFKYCPSKDEISNEEFEPREKSKQQELFEKVKDLKNVLKNIKNIIDNKEIKQTNYFKQICPFCKRDKAFSIHIPNQIYYCFGCHSGGDVISFISKLKNLSQLDAVKFLADEYKLDISNFKE